MNGSSRRSRSTALGATIALVLASLATIAAPIAPTPAGANELAPECSPVRIRGVQVGTACPASGVAPLSVHITNTSSASCTPVTLAPKPDAIRFAFGDGEFLQAFSVYWLNNDSNSGFWCSAATQTSADHIYNLPQFGTTASYNTRLEFLYGANWVIAEANTFRVQLKDSNRAPIAVNDSYILPPNATSAVISVLANDYDLDGDALHVYNAGPITTDGGGTANCSQISCTWHPPAGNPNIATDSFSYTTSDGYGGFTTAVVHIGQPTFDATLHVVGINTDTGQPFGGFAFSACSSVGCVGDYGGLSTRTYTNQVTGTWHVSVFVPYETVVVDPNRTVELTSGDTTTLEFFFHERKLPPAEVGIPSILGVGRPNPFTVSGCPGGTFTAIVDGVTIPMTEISAGLYSAAIVPTTPNPVAITVNKVCPSAGSGQVSFDVNAEYIDPSGFVSTTDGVPLAGATVTLFRSDFAAGPYTLVPDGSLIMSPGNRVNADATDATGHFGWDVIAGYYTVRAAYPGCTDPDNILQPYVDTDPLEIPPAVTDLDIRLACPGVEIPNATPSVRMLAPAQGLEGALLPLRAAVNDYEHDPLTISWSATAGIGVDPGATCTFTSPASIATNVSCTDDGVYELTVQVADADNTATESATLIVANRRPTVTTVTPKPPRIGATLAVDSAVGDPSSHDTLSCTVDFDGPGPRAPIAGTLAAGHCRASSSYPTAGTYALRVKVTDDDGGSTTATTSVLAYNPAKLVVGTASLPAGRVGQAYSATLVALGGKAPYKWKKLNKLPQGLKLAPKTGIISGKPKFAGTVTFGLQATDDARPKRVATKTFAIRVT